MLTDTMSAEAVEVARRRLALAAEDLDGDRVAEIVVEVAGQWGVAAVWERICAPLLAALPGHTATEIAVEHVLSVGVRVGLDVHLREPVRPLPVDGVLLAGAEQELHCLGLHALAAALREHTRGSLLLGPALPWSALASAVRRTRPHTVVVWSQTPVTGRAYRLVRFARDFPSMRVYGAGPGWVEPLTAPTRRLATLPVAVMTCLSPSHP